MRFMLVRYYYGKSSFTWAEIGAMLKECWWLVALFLILFVPRAYLLHREHKQMLEEQEEQERLRERYGELSVKEEIAERPPYEDTYLNTPRSARVPDGEFLYGDPNYTRPRYEWRLFPTLFVLGFVFGMGGSRGEFIGGDNLLLLLLVVVLMVVLFVAKTRPANWVYTSFEEDRREKRHIDWKAVAKGLLPYGLAFLAGLIIGFVQGWLIGR